MKQIRSGRRLAVYLVGVSLLAVLIGACATGAAVDEPRDTATEDGSRSAESSDEAALAGRTNLVQTAGFHLELPEHWVVSHSPDADIALTHTRNGAIIAIRSITPAEYRQILVGLPDAEDALVGGMPAMVDEASMTVLWESRPPHGRGATFSVGPEGSQVDPAVRRDVESMLAGIRFAPIDEDIRRIPDLCTIRSFGTGWYFYQDIPEGVVFTYGSEPQLAVSLRRLDERSALSDGPIESILVSGFGPSLFGYFSVSSKEYGTSISTRFHPLESDLRWMVTILDPERRPPDDLLVDERIVEFFAAGVSLVP